MKIAKKAFMLSVLWVVLLSVAVHFLFLFLCKSFLPQILPFVFLISIVFFVVLFYFATVHYKTFYVSIKSPEILVTRGFIIKRERHLNLKFTTSVKHASTPFMRFLGLSNLLLVFEGSVCLLPLLKSSDAEQLFQSILSISDKK